MAFDLFLRDSLLTKIAATGVELRVVEWLKDFLLGCSQRFRVDVQLTEDVRVISGVLQGRVLGRLMFLAYVNDIWRKTETNILLFVYDCLIYREIMDSSDIDATDGPKLIRTIGWRKWNEDYSGQNKTISFTTARAKERIRYYLGDQLIPEANSFKY